MKIYRKLSHLLISFVLIFNQLGVDFNMHYCGGSFSSLSFINQSTDCGMHSGTDINLDNVPTYSSESCCKDQILNTNLIDTQLEPILEINNQELSNSSFFKYNFNRVDKFLIKCHLFKEFPLIQKKKYLLFVQIIDYV